MLCMLLNLSASAQFYDDFSDGNFSANPAWKGVDSLWDVQNGQLVSNAHTPNFTFSLSTPSQAIRHTVWEWYCQLQLNTSAQNYVEVQLVSDSNSAIVVRIGSTDDDLCLYRRQGNTYTQLIDGANGLTNHSNNTLRIKVYCDSQYHWALQRDSTGTGEHYVTEGTAQASFTPWQSNFSVSIKQSTASFFSKHHFDDFYVGRPITDTTAPVLDSFIVRHYRQLELVWSEPVDSSAAEAMQYAIAPPLLFPDSVVFSGKRMVLKLPHPLPNGVYTLQTPAVHDKAGNTLALQSLPFTIDHGSRHEVLISEIMADPTPPLQLPEYKYLELVNRSRKPLRLLGWTFSDDKHTAQLPDLVLPPDSFLILTGSTTARTALAAYGRTASVSNFPTLNVTGSTVLLRNDEGATIDAVTYNHDTYADASKADGGYSLERISLQQPCIGATNWQASQHPSGGTPGAANSPAPIPADVPPPAVTGLQITGNRQLLLSFNKTVDSAVSATQGRFTIDHGLQAIAFRILPPLMQSIAIHLNQEPDSMQAYTLAIQGITDCSGQSPVNDNLRFGLPQQPIPGDLLINELLFDPVGAGSDYVEFINNSAKIFNLKDVRIGNRNSKDSIDHLYALSPADRLCFPGELMVVTTDRNFVLQNYPVLQPQNLLQITTLPSFPNDKGHVVLLNAAGDIIDELAYSDHMHHPLLHNKEGVALERLSLALPTMQTDNWTSTIASAGYGTPTGPNSHTMAIVDAGDWVSVSPPVFSPDQDGWQDELQISLHLPGNDYQATLRIIDRQGQLVQELVGNQSTDAQHTFLWNGSNATGGLAEAGIYLLEASFFNLAGQSQRCRKVFAITNKKR